MTDAPYITSVIEWRGIRIEVRYAASWLPAIEEIYGHPIAHLELEAIAPQRAKLPVTETGYRSHFCTPAEIEAAGGPASYARAWLDHEAGAKAWRESEAASRQMTLF